VKPVVNISKLRGVWHLISMTGDAIEKHIGRKTMNRFYSKAFLITHNDEALAKLVEKYVRIRQ
jgi:hypothetical protein